MASQSNDLISLAPISAATTVNRMAIVFQKEVREIFRDKRTRFSVIISPLLITPLLFALMGKMISSQVADAKAGKLQVGYVGDANNAVLAKIQKIDPNVQWTNIKVDEIEKSVKDHKVKAVAVLPPEMGSDIASDKTVIVKIFFDAGNEGSSRATDRVTSMFDKQGQKIVAERLAKNNLSPELATPFKMHPTPISSGGTTALMVLSSLLPYILAISAISGGIYAANDLVAGEKERGTMETLLVTPASRRDIVLGKYFAVATVCMTSSLLSVVGLLIPFYSHLPVYNWLTRGGGLTLSPISILSILFVQLPLAVLFAGALLALSTYARNQKEAQTYLGPVMILVMVPSMMSMMVKADSGLSFALVPVLNATLVLKQALSGAVNPSFMVVAVLASVFYAGIALTFAVKLFQKESVLLKA